MHVSQLRKLLGRHHLETKAPGYLLRVEPDALDLERFQRLHDAGEFDEALSLWRGPPLAEFAPCASRRPRSVGSRELRFGLPRKTHRARPRPRPPHRVDRRTRSPGSRASAQGACPCPADDVSLPLRSPGGGARGLPGRALGAGRGARHRSRPIPPRPAPGDPEPGSGARPARDRNPCSPSSRRRRLQSRPVPSPSPARRGRPSRVSSSGSRSPLRAERTLDPEALRRVTRRAFREVEAAVEQHGGTSRRWRTMRSLPSSGCRSRTRMTPCAACEPQPKRATLSPASPPS